MRKILAYLLIAAMLLSTLGCQSVSCGNAPPQVNGQTYTDIPGVEIRITRAYTEDGKTHLNVVWSNSTAYEVTYGEPYAIERLEADRWVSCVKTEAVFIAIGYLLKSGEETTKTYAVSDLFDVSTPGTYRFITSCSVYARGENSQNCALWAEFTVGGSKDHAEIDETVKSADLYFPKPPAGTLITPNGEIPLTLGGYSWTHKMANGTMEYVVADQASRPVGSQHLQPVVLDQQLEVAYTYDPETGIYKATDSLEYLVKLSWESSPTSISYSCWPDAVWQNSDTPEQTVYFFGHDVLYAKPGGYIYEIVATWEDNGAGYSGTANYYVYITDES